MEWVKLILNVLALFIGKGWLWNISGGATEGSIRGFYWIWSQKFKVKEYGFDETQREPARKTLSDDLRNQLGGRRVPAYPPGPPDDTGTTARPG